MKPSKPHPDFPLYAHAVGQWAKKVQGKVYYFGAWADPQAALKRWLAEKDELLAGRRPVRGNTVRDLVNLFLASREARLDSGEIGQRTFDDYMQTCGRVVKAIGGAGLAKLGPQEFARLREALAKGRGLVAAGNEINRARVLFKYAYDEGLVQQPFRYGQSFARPSQGALRRVKKTLMLSAEEIRALLGAAGKNMKAMIYLGVNGGLGNTDCCRLTADCFVTAEGRTWLDYPRPKTGIKRRIPLWPETLEAVRAAQKSNELIFITRRGMSWKSDTVAKEMAKLLAKVGVDREGVNFYTLRRVFETVGGETGDQVAVDSLMGHARNDMGTVYRQGVSPDRLIRVVEFIREWLSQTATERG